MKHSCVVVADGARCRFFTVEEPLEPRFEGGPGLLEHIDLVNPEGEIAGKKLFGNQKSGRGRAPCRGSAHGFDDHRSRHLDEVERRFARRVVDAVLSFARENRAERIVLVADSRMLGILRDELDAEKHAFALDELAQDLSSHAVSHIQDVLTHRGLLLPRHPPSLAYRSRGQPPPN